MSITVTEKRELKTIISNKVDKRILRLEMENATGLDLLKAAARELAMKELELAAYYQKDADLTATIARLSKEQDTMREETAKSLGVEHDWQPSEHIDTRLGKATEVAMDRLLAENEVGKEILRLKAEKDSMLETVWIATSTAQVKELFLRVNAVLGETPTELAQKANAIKAD